MAFSPWRLTRRITVYFLIYFVCLLEIFIYKQQQITIDLNNLFFRPTGLTKETKLLVVPFNETPHYRFARDFIKNWKHDPSYMPQATGYKRYTEYEFQQRKTKVGSHSDIKFRDHLVRWLTNKPHLVIQVEKIKDRDSYVITDGAHRTAFLLASGEQSVLCHVWPEEVKAVVGQMPAKFLEATK